MLKGFFLNLADAFAAYSQFGTQFFKRNRLIGQHPAFNNQTLAFVQLSQTILKNFLLAGSFFLVGKPSFNILPVVNQKINLLLRTVVSGHNV